MELLEQYFDTAFAASDGIKKLRELILTLAMQGKLVLQNPKDQPAGELLKEIEAEKRRLVKEGKIKTPKPLPTIKLEDVPYQLPEGWEWVRLGRITSKITDGDHKTPPRISSGFRLLSAKNVRDGYLDFGNCDFISEQHYLKSRERCRPDTGDLLIVSVGGTIGRTSLVPDDTDFALVRSVALIKPLHIDSSYLKYAMDSRLLQDSIHVKKRGGAQPCLYLSEIEKFVFPLPPLPEQHRIVTKIDQLMARCDELEKLRAEREQTRRSVHTAALKQLLDAQERASFTDAWQFITQHFGELYAVKENVAELRKAILQFGMQGKLIETINPTTSWKNRRLKELTTKIGSGATPSGGKESYQESGIPLIRSMNIHFGGFVRNGLVFLSEAQAEKLKNASVKANDVLLNITGASIGRVAIAPVETEGARVNQHVCIIRPTAEILPRFLEMFLASPIVQNLIDEIQVGATREALTKVMIEQFEIPLPSIPEQQRIVVKIDQLMALCDALEQDIDAATRKQTDLLNAVMSRV